MSELPGYDRWKLSGPPEQREVLEAEDMIGRKLIYDDEFAEVTGYYEEGLGSRDPDDYELMYVLTVYKVRRTVAGHITVERKDVELTSGQLEEALHGDA